MDQMRREHEDLLVARYPGYPAMVYLARESKTSPLALALATATRALTRRGGFRLPATFAIMERWLLMVKWEVRKGIRGNRV
jgi:hypothetical protein